jgi:O-antigen ligase
MFPNTASPAKPHQPASFSFRSARVLAKNEMSSNRLAITTILLVLIGCLALPYGLISVAPSPVRLGYPLYALVLGLVIRSLWRPCYLPFCVGLLAFGPFLRRIADYHAGFMQTNPILLAPYVALLPCIPALLRLLSRPHTPVRWAFMVMVICFCYASALAVAGGSIVAAFYEPLRWVIPVSVCAIVIERPAEAAQIKFCLRWALIVILPVMTVYGLAQYISPSAWDLVWMNNIANDSFGHAAPFEVRVFSTMNGPGITAVFIASAMLFLLGEGLLGNIIAMLAIPLLALTLVRAAWLGFGIGLAIIFVLTSPRGRVGLLASLAGLVLAVSLFMSSPAIPPELQNYLQDRVSSFTDLREDASANDRLNTYGRSIDRIADNPWGEGYGANASATTASQKKELDSLDSGLLEAVITYGIVGGILYLISLGTLTVRAWIGWKRDPVALSASFACVCGIISILPLGSSQIAESSIIIWILFGLLLAQTSRQAILPASVIRM